MFILGFCKFGFKIGFSHYTAKAFALMSLIKKKMLVRLDYNTIYINLKLKLMDVLTGRSSLMLKRLQGKYSVPLFEKEELGEIFIKYIPSIPLFQRGR